MKNLLYECVLCQQMIIPNDTIDIYNNRRGSITIDIYDGTGPYLDYRGNNIVVPKGRYLTNESGMYVICYKCISKLMDDELVNGFYIDHYCQYCNYQRRLFYTDGERIMQQFICHSCVRYRQVDRPYYLEAVHEEIKHNIVQN